MEGTKTGLPNPNIGLYRELMEKGIPMVFMHGNYEALPGTLSVLDDNAAGGRMLVDYLYGKGHRKIACIFKYDDIQGRQRFTGYLDAMQELGLPLVMVNKTGMEPEGAYTGGSCAVGSDGRLVARADCGGDILYVEFPLDESGRLFGANPSEPAETLRD